MKKHMRSMSALLLLGIALMWAGCNPGSVVRPVACTLETAGEVAVSAGAAVTQSIFGCNDQNCRACYGDTGTVCGCPTDYCPVHLDSCSTIDTELLCVNKAAPAIAGVNEDVEVLICVTARQYISDVEIRDTFESDFTLVSADPQPERNGNELTWFFDTMEPGENKKISLVIRSAEIGCLLDCVTAHARPRACSATSIGQPELELTKCGPDMLCLGFRENYIVEVSNPGSATARDVVVVDTLPEGLEHPSGEREFVWEVGDLDSNCSRKFTLCLEGVERGNFCNKAKASSLNTPDATAEKCTTVVMAALDVTKTGPAEIYVGKTADYTISVFNSGDIALSDVAVVDRLPCGVEVFDTGGGYQSGNQISWEIGTLEPDASASVRMSMTTNCPGVLENMACVSGYNNVCCTVEASAMCTTDWLGHPGLLIEMIDTCDPMLVGESTCYRIRITNQGTADDTNVVVVANFPPQLEPLSACGATAATIDGQAVTFRPFERLGCGESIEFQITARANATGDARVRVQMTSDHLDQPVNEEESTYIY